MTSTTLEKFDIRNFIDCLTSAKGKNRYICPVCSGNNLTIDPKTGEYQCWNGCQCKDIREAVSPWNEATPNCIPRQQTHSKLPSPAPIPDGLIELARLSGVVELPQKRKRGHRTEIEYPYSDTQWVLRIEEPNPKKRKGYKKITIPHHINAAGETIQGKGDAAWNPYRIDEVAAHGAGKWVLGIEGESCTEAARYLGLVGFTLQGSAWNDDELTRAMLQAKTVGVAGVAYFPDNDETGHKKAHDMAAAAAKVQLPFVQLDPLALWSDMPEKGDIADWVKWGMSQEWDKDELIRRLEEQFNATAYAVREEQCDRLDEEASSDDWDDIPDSANPDIAFTQKLLNFLYGDKPWICADGKLYFWTGTHYEHSPDSVERRKITGFCNAYAVVNKDKISYPYAKPSKVDEGLKWVKYSLEVDSRQLNPPGLNCTNGVLEIRWDVVSTKPVPSWELVPHEPSKFYTYEPLVKYDPEANPQACDRMLAALDAPQRDIFLKTIAASLDLATVRKYKGRLVRALLLKGHGSNGKDTLREAVSAMYGHQGMTNKTLADFAAYDDGRKFPLATLKFSRVNWASENANTTRLDKIQSLKAFITGDNLDSERKGKDEDPFKPKGIALFNVNDTPNLQGTLEAIKSRYGVLLFNKTFKVGADLSKGELEADPRFKDDPEFLRTEVLSAFLNRILDALVRLMSEGIDYSYTEKALEDIQAENSHLFQFCKDTKLGYDPTGVLTASDIWTRLEQWYQDNGTLTYEEGTNGKQKAVWAEQSKPSDRNVKAVNQVIARFRALFPKTKLVTVPHESGKKNIQALQGIAFLCDNNLEPRPPQFHPNSTPIPPQKTTEIQGLHLTHPKVLTPVEKIENPDIDPCNVSQKISATPRQLGWVGCDEAKSSIPGVDNWSATEVETAVAGVGEPATITPDADAQAPTIDFSDIINRTNVELKRLGWTTQQGRDYLVQAYGKRSRQLLTNAELVEFLQYLQSQSTPVEQTASTSGDDSRLAQDEVTVTEELSQAEAFAPSADADHDDCDEECWAFHPRYRDWHYGRVVYRTGKSVGVRFTADPKPTRLDSSWVVAYNRDNMPVHAPTKS